MNIPCYPIFTISISGQHFAGAREIDVILGELHANGRADGITASALLEDNTSKTAAESM